MSKTIKTDNAVAFNYLKESCSLFKNASYEHYIRSVSSELTSTKYSSGEPICTPSQINADVGIITKGGAAVYSADGGRQVLLRFLSPGDIYGVASLFSNSPPPTRIISLSECNVIHIPRSAMKAWLWADKALMNDFLSFLSNKICYLNQKISCVTAGCGERRLAIFLMSLPLTEYADDSAYSLKTELKQNMVALAKTLDIGRASLYRAFESLEEAGAAKRLESGTVLINTDELNKICNIK